MTTLVDLVHSSMECRRYASDMFGVLTRNFSAGAKFKSLAFGAKLVHSAVNLTAQ